MNVIRLNYYPKCPHPDVVLGVSRHKDPDALTVLVQDEVGGLEVRRKDGQWVGIQPRRDAFVINVGDLFQDLPLYRTYNFGEFHTHQITTNYKVSSEENIQISDFAINRD